DHDGASPLGSILLDVANGSLDVVATNRFWMAVQTLPVTGSGPDGRIVLGLPAATDLASTLDSAGEVAVEIGPDRVTADGLELTGRDAAYPAHRVILEGLEPARTTAILATGELVSAVRAIGRSEVTLTLANGDAKVGADDRPSHKVQASVRGEEFAVRLGSALMLRALAATLGDEVRLELAA